MLNIQNYLRNGKTPEDLTKDFAIKVTYHPTLPIFVSKYCQIDSPKADPVVMEARGIVLEKETYNVVAKGFTRFFNFGEQPELFANFDWTSFRSDSKEDGSLQLLYFYANEWHVNTSGSFGLAECNFSGKTWRDLFWQTSGLTPEHLKPFQHLTLIFELWTPFNKVVRVYPTSKVWLLGAFETRPSGEDENPRELNPRTVDHIAGELRLERPLSYDFKSIDEIMSFIKGKEDTDKTFEGVVVRDKNNVRAKIK